MRFIDTYQGWCVLQDICLFLLVPFSFTQVLLPSVWVGSGVVQEEGGVLGEVYSIWENKYCNPWGFATAESICGDGGCVWANVAAWPGSASIWCGACALVSNSAALRSSLKRWRKGKSSLKWNASNIDEVYTTINLCFTVAWLFPFPIAGCLAGTVCWLAPHLADVLGNLRSYLGLSFEEA